MLYQTAIPAEAMDEQELLDLVKQLAKISGQEITIQKQIVIMTDSTDLSTILDTLADTMRDKCPLVDVKKNGHKKPVEKKFRKKNKSTEDGFKPAPTRGPHVKSIKIESTREMISRFELDKRLRERTIEPNTQLHSPKHGTMTVRNNVPAGEPYQLVNLIGEVI